MGEEEEGDGVRFSDDCRGVTAAAPLPDDDDCCSKCINCKYMLLPLRMDRESDIITKEPTNNITYAALNLKVFFSCLCIFLIKVLLNHRCESIQP